MLPLAEVSTLWMTGMIQVGEVSNVWMTGMIQERYTPCWGLNDSCRIGVIHVKDWHDSGSKGINPVEFGMFQVGKVSTLHGTGMIQVRKASTL